MDRRHWWIMAGIVLGMAVLAVVLSMNSMPLEQPVEPVARPVVPEPAKRPVRAVAAKVIRLHRPPPVATPPPAGSDAPTPEPVSPPPPAPLPTEISLEDLHPDELKSLTEEALERIGELVEACDAFAPEHTRVAAHATLDARGLLEMELSPYRDDEPDVVVDPDVILPPELVDCLDDQMWDQSWPTAPPGTELPVALTMRMGEEPTTEE